MRNPLAIVGAVDIHLAAAIGTIEQACEGSRFAPAVWIAPYIAADFLLNRTKLVLSKMLVLLLFAVGFMAVGGLVNLAVLLFQGWEPVGFWTLFGVGIEEGLIMWVGALPCILLVVLLNKNYIVSVVITFFYTTANYILSMSDAFLTQPFGLNIGTLFPGPLAFRWTFQFYDQSQTSAELADLLERISPYFLNGVQVFGVIVGEAVVFLALIALVYRRQEI